MINRYEELLGHDIKIENFNYIFNKKTVRYERQLANKRKNAARKRGRINLLKEIDIDSSSSSSRSSD